MPIAYNEINPASRGGTEMMCRRLDQEFTEKDLEHVQIIPSRVRELDDEKVRIFWAHDLPHDPESEKALKDRSWKKFDKLIFVSHWQKQQYMNVFEIPPNKCTVLQNAIDPIPQDDIKKPDDKIKLIYHTTPHRGLDIAYHAVDALVKKAHPEIEFHVYSSFKIYGWEERDEQFQEMYNLIDQHPNMIYHGTVENEKVRMAVAESHIFAYPSSWPETSCISLMEAMSAKCLCVHSDLAALPETGSNWTYMYNFSQDKKEHLDLFASCLNTAVDIMKRGSNQMDTRLSGQKSYTDLFYNWQLRRIQWEQLLEAAKTIKPRPVDSTVGETYELDEFVYQV